MFWGCQKPDFRLPSIRRTYNGLPLSLYFEYVREYHIGSRITLRNPSINHFIHIVFVKGNKYTEQPINKTNDSYKRPIRRIVCIVLLSTVRATLLNESIGSAQRCQRFSIAFQFCWMVESQQIRQIVHQNCSWTTWIWWDDGTIHEFMDDAGSFLSTRTKKQRTHEVVKIATMSKLGRSQIFKSSYITFRNERIREVLRIDANFKHTQGLIIQFRALFK